MFDVDSVYPKIETEYALTSDMNDKLVNEFNQQSFKSLAMLNKYYNPQDILLQHIPIKEELGKIEVNRLRNG